MIALKQGRPVERVTPPDVGGITSVQEHIHAGKRDSLAVRFLAIEPEVVGTDLFPRAQKKRARTACRVADQGAALRCGELRDNLRNCAWCEKFASLLASVRSELLNEVDVSLADCVFVHGAEVQTRLSEVLQNVLEAAVAVFRLAETNLRVEIDVAEDTIQLWFVRLFESIEHHVDQLTDIVAVAPLIETVETRKKGLDDLALLVSVLDRLQLETLALKPSPDSKVTLGMVAEFRKHVVVVLVPDIADVLQKEQGEDVVLILLGIDHSTKSIASGPDRILDAFCSSHWWSTS